MATHIFTLHSRTDLPSTKECTSPNNA